MPPSVPSPSLAAAGQAVDEVARQPGRQRQRIVRAGGEPGVDGGDQRGERRGGRVVRLQQLARADLGVAHPLGQRAETGQRREVHGLHGFEHRGDLAEPAVHPGGQLAERQRRAGCGRRHRPRCEQLVQLRPFALTRARAAGADGAGVGDDGAVRGEVGPQRREQLLRGRPRRRRDTGQGGGREQPVTRVALQLDQGVRDAGLLVDAAGQLRVQLVGGPAGHASPPLAPGRRLRAAPLWPRPLGRGPRSGEVGATLRRRPLASTG